MRKVTILGGGATGMVLACLLSEAGHKVSIVEGSQRLGGLLSTFKTAGDPLEYYYHHFFTHDAEIHWLLDHLGLSQKLFYRPSSVGFFRQGRIFDFTTALDLLRFSPLGLIDKARFAATSLYLSRQRTWRDYEDISCLDWFYRFAGKSVTETVWKPMLEVKFGSYADQVPLAWMVGRLSQRMQSRKSGREVLGYVSGSLQVLVDALHRRLLDQGVQIECGRAVRSLRVEENRIKGLCLEDGQELAADEVIATLPSPVIAGLLPPGLERYGEELRQVEYFGAICLVLRMRRPLSRIYWLNAADPGFPYGGVIEHTNFVPPERYGGEHIAYLSRYFESSHALATESPEKIAADWIGTIPRINPDFDVTQLIGWDLFRTRTAATVCPLEFSKRVHRFFSPIGGFYVVNMTHIYPDERSVNNSIRIAAEALSALEIPHRVPRGRSLAGQIGFERS